MEGQNSVQNFFFKLTTRPHIAENIVNQLCCDDIDNCLKASDDFKPLLATGLNWNQDDFEYAEARSAFTSGTLDSRQFGPIRKGSWNEKGKTFCFGLDGTLWMIKTKSTGRHNQDWSSADDDTSDEENKRDDGYSHILVVYSLQSGKEISTLMLTCKDPRPRIRILPCKKVLVQDKYKLTVFSNGDGGKTVDIVEEHRLKPYKLELEPQPFYGEDCIFKIENYDRESDVEDDGELEDIEFVYYDYLYRIHFSRADGHLMTDSQLGLTDLPIFLMLQKGQYVLIVDGGLDEILILDIDRNEFVSLNEEDYDYPSFPSDVFMTSTFCGFLSLRDEYRSTPEIKYMGYFELSLYDNDSGESIYYGRFSCVTRSSEFEVLPTEPRVVANGKYLMVCGIQGGSLDEENERFLKVLKLLDAGFRDMVIAREDMENKLLCIKVDPKSKQCQERKTNTGYELALLARALLDEKETLNGDEAEENRYRMPKVQIHEVSLLGFAFESVVVCQVVFDCDGFYKAFKECKTILTIDLDKIFESEEPASVFSAVNFPLGHNVLESSQRSRYYGDDFIETKHELEYYQYYETRVQQDGSGRVRLAGIVEVSSEKSTSMIPKVYSFKNSA